MVFANTEYAINYATGMQNGTVTGPDTAKEDDEVTLTITPAAGYVLESISVTGVTTENAVEVTDGKFTMPAEDVNVIATFKLVTYAITLAEGTEDAENWSVPAEAAAGSPVTATYSGEKKVKSVKAVKKASGNAYLKWDADQKKLVATEIPTTAIKVENSNENVSWEGTYVVEEEVTINGSITLTGDVDLIIKDGAKLTANNIIGESNILRIYGQAQMTGEMVVNCTAPYSDAISTITTLEVHSAKVTASCTGSNYGGFYRIKTFNVYGGLVDAKNKGAEGTGIGLKESGSMNIYGGEVKAEGKGDSSYSYGIMCDGSTKATVTVYGGKLWAGNEDKRALNSGITLQKGADFTGKIETSDNGSSWTQYNGDDTPDSKYVRVGY